mgnify:CR=1 FL=1
MEPLITPQEIHIYESLDQITVKRKTKLGKLMELQFFLNDQKPLGKLHKYKNKWSVGGAYYGWVEFSLPTWL